MEIVNYPPMETAQHFKMDILIDFPFHVSLFSFISFNLNFLFLLVNYNIKYKGLLHEAKDLWNCFKVKLFNVLVWLKVAFSVQTIILEARGKATSIKQRKHICLF